MILSINTNYTVCTPLDRLHFPIWAKDVDTTGGITAAHAVYGLACVSAQRCGILGTRTQRKHISCLDFLIILQQGFQNTIHKSLQGKFVDNISFE